MNGPHPLAFPLTYTAKTRRDLDAILVQFPRSTTVILPPKLTGARIWRAIVHPGKGGNVNRAEAIEAIVTDPARARATPEARRQYAERVSK